MPKKAKPRRWRFDGQSVLDENGKSACTKANGQLIADAPLFHDTLHHLLLDINNQRTGHGDTHFLKMMERRIKHAVKNHPIQPGQVVDASLPDQ